MALLPRWQAGFRPYASLVSYRGSLSGLPHCASVCQACITASKPDLERFNHTSITIPLYLKSSDQPYHLHTRRVEVNYISYTLETSKSTISLTSRISLALDRSRLVLALMGTKYEARGTERLRPDQHYVLACNHESLTDTALIYRWSPVLKHFHALLRFALPTCCSSDMLCHPAVANEFHVLPVTGQGFHLQPSPEPLTLNSEPEFFGVQYATRKAPNFGQQKRIELRAHLWMAHVPCKTPHPPPKTKLTS